MDYDKLKDEVVELVKVMEVLRSPEGCPWDKEQDYKSLQPYIIEEAYEVVETIQNNDISSLKEELGDLLLQVVFQAQIANEEGDFDLIDIFSGIRTKLIRRHPHVFGELDLTQISEVKMTWDKIKAHEKEKKDSEDEKSLMDDFCRSQPASNQAYEIQEKAAKVGFDWDDVEDVIGKIEEETDEIKEEISNKDIEAIEDELGDIMFAVVNLARFYDINPELALLKTINKFRKRFKYIERNLKKENQTLLNTSLEKMEDYWEKAKVKK
jgi:tetrapyrrole methylase family protein/MazG family protein